MWTSALASQESAPAEDIVPVEEEQPEEEVEMVQDTVEEVSRGHCWRSRS